MLNPMIPPKGSRIEWVIYDTFINSVTLELPPVPVYVGCDIERARRSQTPRVCPCPMDLLLHAPSVEFNVCPVTPPRLIEAVEVFVKPQNVLNLIPLPKLLRGRSRNVIGTELLKRCPRWLVEGRQVWVDTLDPGACRQD